jgi:hypothetical protein
MKSVLGKNVFVKSAVLICLLLAACGPSAAELTPTLDPNLIRTEAVSTFAFSLTQTALAAPTNTPSPTPSPTKSPIPFVIGTAATSTGAAAIKTCYGLAFIDDVTVPDDTQMTPGEKFTKTWRVQNTGSCAWAPGFTFSLIGGEAMGGQTLTLTEPVQIGATTDLSIKMIAPANKTGSIQGTWKMADSKGTYFGDAPWVKIMVGGASGTSTPTEESPTPTETS